MQFTAIDVETANADMASICQVGLAKFDGDRLVGEWSTLVDPEDYFDGFNTHIHGIQPHMVRGQPKLLEIAEKLREYLENTTSVSHTHFDRVSVMRAFSRYGLKPIATSWLDSARVARRTWKDLSSSGYGLSSVCERIGYRFRHHDALEDAKAAGYVLLAAIRASELDLVDWHHRARQPIDPSRIHRDGTSDGDLYGEIMVFTGALELPRREAADLAASVGCQVESNVTKETTILVVGDQDTARLAGHDKSTKHRKAEQLASEGYPIRILREIDFRLLVGTALSSEEK